MNLWGDDRLENFEDPVELIESRQRDYPIALDPDHFIETRVYLVDFRDYNRLPLSDQGPDDLNDAYLVAQNFMERTGNLVKFFRQYANIPSTRREPSTFSYRFPAFAGDEIRTSFEETVNAQIQFDYFLPGVSKGINSYRDIEVIPAQKYHIDGKPDRIVNYVSDGEHLSLETNPTRTEYQALIAAKTEIVAEDSKVGIYLGNIVERQTIYILPK